MPYLNCRVRIGCMGGKIEWSEVCGRKSGAVLMGVGWSRESQSAQNDWVRGILQNDNKEVAVLDKQWWITTTDIEGERMVEMQFDLTYR